MFVVYNSLAFLCNLHHHSSSRVLFQWYHMQLVQEYYYDVGLTKRRVSLKPHTPIYFVLLNLT